MVTAPCSVLGSYCVLVIVLGTIFLNEEYIELVIFSKFISGLLKRGTLKISKIPRLVKITLLYFFRHPTKRDNQ